VAWWNFGDTARTTPPASSIPTIALNLIFTAFSVLLPGP
jgi:hypothetical protein